jgi:parallel beta-helix repeat protein
MLSMETQAATITVGSNGSDFACIQAAIDAADPGDKILVYSGTYYENVDVNIPIILRGVDTGTGRPLVDAGRNGSAITLSADGCTLEGFVVINSGTYLNYGFQAEPGIKVISNYNILTANTAIGNTNGITLSHSSSNTLEENSVINDREDGIHLEYSNDNTISNNIAINNVRNGIYFLNCRNNTIMGNNVSNNADGIILSYSRNNKIENNSLINNRGDGIYQEYSNNTTEDFEKPNQW